MVAIDMDRHPACLVATVGYSICDSCSPAIRSLVATKTQADIILTTVKIRISEEPELLSMPSEAQQSKLQQPWKKWHASLKPWNRKDVREGNVYLRSCHQYFLTLLAPPYSSLLPHHWNHLLIESSNLTLTSQEPF
jgi:hypothetical protein